MKKRGQMRHLMMLQERLRVRDAAGGFEENWQEIDGEAGCWCAVTPLNNSLRPADLQRQDDGRVRIMTAYRSDVKTGMRLADVARGVAYDIESVMNIDERSMRLEILARRV